MHPNCSLKFQWIVSPGRRKARNISPNLLLSFYPCGRCIVTSTARGRAILEHETRIHLAFPQQTPMAAIFVLVATILDLVGDVGFVILHVLLSFSNIPFHLFLQGTHNPLGHVVPVVLDKGGTSIAATGTVLEHERLVVRASPLFRPHFAFAELVLAGIFVGGSRIVFNLAAEFVARTTDLRCRQEPNQHEGEQPKASQHLHLASAKIH